MQRDPVLGTGMALQGLGGENVKILVDGIPVIGRQNGNIDLGQLPLENIQRIEMIEGPLSVLYGTNALAGTINLITRKDAGTSASASVYGDNTGTVRNNARFSFSGSRYRASFHASRHYFDGWNPGDPAIPDVRRRQADSSRYQAWKPRTQWFGGFGL